MSTAIEYALTNPAEALSIVIIIIMWAILAIPGLWFWLDKGVIPMRERWRSNWDVWPRANFMEAVFVTLFIGLLWVVWLRIVVFLLGMG